MRRAAALLLAIVAACGGGGDGPEPAHAAAPAPPPERPLGPKVFPMDRAPVLDDPRRDEWQHPDEIMKALRIGAGARVADIGCGTGYFTLRLLRAAGPSGRVIAVDIQQGMLDRLAKRLGSEERGRVTLRKSAPERPLEAGDACDLVLCANTLHEVDEAELAPFMRSMAEGVAPGGRLALVNWKAERMQLGPPLGNRIAAQRVRELAEGAGLALEEELDILPYHSFLLFRKPR